MIKIIALSWLIILIALIFFSIVMYIIKKNKNKNFNNILIINKPESFKKTKQLNLANIDNSVNDFMGNTTQFTLLTWLVVNPVNRKDFLKKNSFPLTNILCKGDVNNPLPMILYNHYTNSLYFYISIGDKSYIKTGTTTSSSPNSLSTYLFGNTTKSSSKSVGLLKQISILGEDFWIDLEQNPQNYPNIYIIPNILVGRWFQLGFSINNDILEIFFNGKLKNTFILQSAAVTDNKQNLITLGPITSELDTRTITTSNKNFGLFGKWLGADNKITKTSHIEKKHVKIDGFAGELSGLRYSSKILSIQDINEIYNKGLNDNSFSDTRSIKDHEFNKKTVSVMKPILAESEKLLNKIKRKLTRDKQSVQSLEKNQNLLSQICNRNDYVPSPLPNQSNCMSDCDCFGISVCDKKTSKCSINDLFETNQNKNPDCILISSTNDITDNNLGLLTKAPVNSYICDNLCYKKNNILQSKPSCKIKKGQDTSVDVAHGNVLFKTQCPKANDKESCMKIDPYTKDDDDRYTNSSVSSRCLWTNMDPQSESCAIRSGESSATWKDKCSAANNLNDCMKVDPWTYKNYDFVLNMKDKKKQAHIFNYIREQQVEYGSTEGYTYPDGISSRCKWGLTKKTVLDDCTQSIYDKATEKCYKNNKGSKTKNYCTKPKSSLQINNIIPKK